MRLGFHVSVAGGLENAVRAAVRRRCSTAQIFTAAPVQWARRKIPAQEAARFRARLAQLDITPHFVHAKYLLNVCSPDPGLRERSIRDLARELKAAQGLGAAGVVLHLGSVGDDGTVEDGVARVAAAVDRALERVPDGPHLLLENSAGQGNMVGSRFEELAGIVALAGRADRVRVCLDTAHAFGAGYPLHTAPGLRKTLAEADATFGLERLALLHVNDSLAPLGSGRDRHWHIGRGEIGRKGMARILNHPRLRHLPYIMETPGTEQDDLSNMRRVRRLIRPALRPFLPPLPDWARH